MEKLVRDKIPEIIRADEKEPQFRVVANNDYLSFLLKKLQEEVTELLEDPKDIGEHADVREVLEAIQKTLKITPENIEKTQKAKRDARGGFDEGFILKVD